MSMQANMLCSIKFPTVYTCVCIQVRFYIARAKIYITRVRSGFRAKI